MNDRIANRIAAFRTRLSCLDRDEHRPLWEGVEPLAFTEKVGEARALTAQLIEMAGRQSAPLRGITRQKQKHEAALIDTSLALSRCLVVFCRDQRMESIGGRHDYTRRDWARARDEAKLGRARVLVADATELAAGPHAARAAEYGIHPESIARLAAAAAAYEAQIGAPQSAIQDRTVLTRNLPIHQKAVKAKFAELDDLAPQFATTPQGADFVAAFRASRRIVDRGKGKSPAEVDGEPPVEAV